jgi:hypothetical protein
MSQFLTNLLALLWVMILKGVNSDEFKEELLKLVTTTGGIEAFESEINRVNDSDLLAMTDSHAYSAPVGGLFPGDGTVIRQLFQIFIQVLPQILPLLLKVNPVQPEPPPAPPAPAG